MDRVILGGGINGLILSSVLQAPCIGENIGGFIKSDFDAPKILECSSEEIINYVSKYTNIGKENDEYFYCGYYYKGGVTDILDVDATVKYARKTEREVYSSVMSCSKNIIHGYDIRDWYDDIMQRAIPVKDHIKKIERSLNGYIIYCGKETFYADMIYNTLPYNILCGLLGTEPEKECLSKDIYYYTCDEKLFAGYDYMYLIDSDIIPYRITRNGDKFIIESLVDVSEMLFDGKLIELKNRMVCKNAKMINTYSNRVSTLQGIINVGRYANWNHSLKMDDVIRQAMQIKSLSSI